MKDIYSISVVKYAINGKLYSFTSKFNLYNASK